MARKITSEVLESYLHCKFKGHLKFAGNQGTICDFESLHSELRATEWVPAVDARCPPAEKPMIPMHSGLTPHILALARTIRRARCASYSGTNARRAAWLRSGRRYS